MIEISAYAVKYDQLKAAIFQFISLNYYQAYYLSAVFLQKITNSTEETDHILNRRHIKKETLMASK